MADPAFTDRIIAQGRALVRAIEGLGTIEPSGWFERAIARLLLAGTSDGYGRSWELRPIG